MDILRTKLLIILLVNNCECFSISVNFIYGRRLIGSMLNSKGMIGPQMCVMECSKTMTGCKSINYHRNEFICEYNNADQENITEQVLLEHANGYFFIRMSALDSHSEVSGSLCQTNACQEWEDCLQLTSGTVKCIRVKPKDCAELGWYGVTSSSVYTMSPAESVTVRAFCDMETDKGGWTVCYIYDLSVFQRRLDDTVDFYRNWTEYKRGFGDINGNYWLGNDNLHLLLSNGDSEMRYEMADFNGNTRYLQYDSFYVDDEASLYTVSISGLVSGDVGDCLLSADQKLNGLKFSTLDRDNDIDGNSNCATRFKGSWWYAKCHCTNPNGLYLAGSTHVFAEGMTYYPWLTHYYSLKETTLMVRRKR